MAKTKLLKIDDLVFDEDIYPRSSVWWGTVYKYAEEMRSGSVFPPIIVGDLDDKLLVVDGWNRCAAYRKNGEEYVKAEVRKYDSVESVFIDAVKLNSSHGRPLTSYDKVKIIARLEDFKMEFVEISKLVKVPLDKLGRFKTRILRGPRGTVLLKSIVAKQIEKGVLSKEQAMQIDQSNLKVQSVAELLVQLIDLIMGEAFPWGEPIIAGLAEQLFSLLGEHTS